MLLQKCNNALCGLPKITPEDYILKAKLKSLFTAKRKFGNIIVFFKGYNNTLII